MKVAIMQPYFFPYIGYFQLMAAVNKWLIFDETQFINKGWINRNRILHPAEEKSWQYLTIPLKGKKRFDRLNEVRIDDTRPWRKTIMGKLSIYASAPYYRECRDLVQSCLEFSESSLSSLVIQSLRLTADFLSINTPLLVQSSLNLDVQTGLGPGEWAPYLANELNAIEYINPLAGKDLFKQKDFDRNGIKLSYFQAGITPYLQRRSEFIPSLSIIDVLMWCGKSNTMAMLDEGVTIAAGS